MVPQHLGANASPRPVLVESCSWNHLRRGHYTTEIRLEARGSTVRYHVVAVVHVKHRFLPEAYDSPRLLPLQKPGARHCADKLSSVI